MKKQKRIWTDEQRRAAAERMRIAREARWVKVKQDGSAEGRDVAGVKVTIDGMSPERREKLKQVQSQTISHAIELESRIGSHATMDAMARRNVVEAGAVSDVPVRPGSREVSIIIRNDGTMVSQYGPCVCGAAKRQWHNICLKSSLAEREIMQ